MSARSCPACRTRLRAFWVPSRTGADEIELDRCNDCGGVWFDAGELQQASGRGVKLSRTETDRACPACRVPLLRGKMSGDVDVEGCLDCRGTFLEARDMDTLVKRSPPKRAPGGTGFVCDECGQRRPFSHAQPTLTGLACGDCIERHTTPPAPPARQEARSVFAGFLGWLRGESSVAGE